MSMKVVRECKTVLGLLKASAVLELYSNSSVGFPGQFRPGYGSDSLRVAVAHKNISGTWAPLIVLVAAHNR